MLSVMTYPLDSGGDVQKCQNLFFFTMDMRLSMTLHGSFAECCRLINA